MHLQTQIFTHMQTLVHMYSDTHRYIHKHTFTNTRSHTDACAHTHGHPHSHTRGNCCILPCRQSPLRSPCRPPLQAPLPLTGGTALCTHLCLGGNERPGQGTLRPRHPPRLPLGAGSIKGAGSPPHRHPEHRGLKSPDLTARHQQRGGGGRSDSQLPGGEAGSQRVTVCLGLLGVSESPEKAQDRAPRASSLLRPRPGPLQGPLLTRPTSPISGEGREGEGKGRLRPSQGRRLA